ncbi:hypothetical protein H4S08_003199 [Coemansia sp. RSA 1365]|nr:hypothetical protein H4S08_003199 [Coemansia sp. RSA 1365]
MQSPNHQQNQLRLLMPGMEDGMAVDGTADGTEDGMVVEDVVEDGVAVMSHKAGILVGMAAAAAGMEEAVAEDTGTSRPRPIAQALRFILMRSMINH